MLLAAVAAQWISSNDGRYRTLEDGFEALRGCVVIQTKSDGAALHRPLTVITSGRNNLFFNCRLTSPVAPQ